MHETIERRVREKRLLRQTAAKLSELDLPAQNALLSFIDDFRLGINYSREFTDYLFDIAKRDNRDLALFLKEKNFASLKEQEKLPHARKMELLREWLRKIRYERSIDRAAFSSPAQVAEERKVVFKKQKGKWLKRCPGTQHHICCNYLVINSISGCPYSCTYCYLHTYLNKSEIAIYNNQEDLIEELEGFFDGNRHLHYRIGTGEFSDSLALDKQAGLSVKLIELFAKQENHLLELKTKSAEVNHLLDLDHKGKTVFAWSVNPEMIVRSEELGTVSLTERLKAAGQCARAGYPVAFHFDPIIYYHGWEQDYREVVEKIFLAVEENHIAWISLGALRYPSELKEIMENKFPHSKIILGELDIGEDRKYRYLKPIRTEIFKKMHEFIRSCATEVYVYLCMESADIWKTAKIENQKDNIYTKYFNYYKKA